MGLITMIRERLSLKISLALAATLLVLIAGIGLVLTRNQTRDLEDVTLRKASLAASLGARSYATILESGIDDGLLTTNDVFDRNYQKIGGFNWGDNPKYHTKYDFFTDKNVLTLQDEFLKDDEFVFAVGADAGGYVPTHNTKYSRSLTGNVAKDTIANRTKRIFSDAVATKVAANTEGVLRQAYKRDDGSLNWDVSAPIFVKGRHWGAFRIGVSMEKIVAKQRHHALLLIGLFGIFTVVVLAMVFALVNRSMQPVRVLTETADRISLGDGLEDPIVPRSIDEIGVLTKSIDRLRSSMQGAMIRLGE